MNSIKNYIEKMKKETEGYSEDEIVRAVYIDLGKRLSFNLDFFLGNAEQQKKIYATRGMHMAEEALNSNIIICKDSSHIMEIVLKHLGIDVITTVDPDEYKKKCAHVFNIVRPKDGRPAYKVDLQQDLENIQAHMRTTEFGTALTSEFPDTISRDELERIDKKIGYIGRGYYYADEYIDLLRLYASYFKNIQERLGFVLNNIEIYHNKEMQYAERRKLHKGILKKIFTRDELTKIHQIDCYIDNHTGREYIPCITASTPKRRTDIYLFSPQENKYNKIDYEDLIQQMNNGLVLKQIIPEVKAFEKERKRKEKSELNER